MISTFGRSTIFIRDFNVNNTYHVNEVKQTPFYMRPYIFFLDDNKEITEYKSQDKTFFSYFNLDIRHLTCRNIKKLDYLSVNVFMSFLRAVYKTPRVNIQTYGGCLTEVRTNKYLIFTATKNAEYFKNFGTIDCKDNSDIVVYISEDFFNKEYTMVRKKMLPWFEGVEVVRCSSKYITETFFKNSLSNIRMENEEKINKVLTKGNNLLLDSLDKIETDLKLEKKISEYKKQMYFRLSDANPELLEYELSVCPYPRLIKRMLVDNYLLENIPEVFNVFLNRYLTEKDMSL